FQVSGLWVLMSGLILFGLFGAGGLSYDTLMGVNPCPMALVIRACYLVFFAYLVMGSAQFIRGGGVSRILFWIGWILAFGFAAFGSSAEIIQDDVCPIVQTAGLNIPMCYISLALCIAIAGLYVIVQHRPSR
ncbi:MAG: hypothetical protein KTR29_15230, partial [Rhodothermaceae bacterium]|nr:hypothetical protein [Rhodothermaceae bacterium]